MKKIYLSLFSLVVAGGAMAQVTTAQPMKKNATIGEVSPKTHVAAAGSEKSVVLYQNDFSNAAQWSFVDNSTGPASGDNWVIGTGVPSGDFPIVGIASTTAANGFALYDSDAMCSGNQNADVRLIAPISTIGNPNVSLQFQSFYRKYQGTCYVIVSNNGTTWTEFEVHADLAGNASTANPMNVQVNVSSIIGNTATAYIGFRYIGGCDYAWMVDDVKLVTTDDYDLSLNSLYWGSEGYWGPRLPYYKVPQSQVNNVKFGGGIQNQGALTQTDVVFGVTIPSVFTGTSAPGTIAPNAIDTLDATTVFAMPATIASYTATAGVTSAAVDANPLNNTQPAVTFAVTTDRYARDMGDVQSGSFNQGQAFLVGNIFDINTDANLMGVEVYLNGNTVANAEIYAELYSIDANGEFVSEELTDGHVITAGEIDGWITIPFDAIPLTSLNSVGTEGNSYLLMVGSYGDGGATDDLVVGTSGASEIQTSFYYDPTVAGGTWYYTSATPMVRMITDGALAVNEKNAAFGVNVYPNPAANEANVSFELANASDVTITVTDLAGKVVYTNVLANSAAGKHAVEINTQAFAGGVYTVNFNTNNASVSKKLVVKK